MPRSSSCRAPPRPAFALALGLLIGCGDEPPSDEFLDQLFIYDGKLAKGHTDDDGHDHSKEIFKPLDEAAWVAGRDAR